MTQEPEHSTNRLDGIVRALAIIGISVMLMSFGIAYYYNVRPAIASPPTETPLPTATDLPIFTRTPPAQERTGGELEVYLPGLSPETIRTKFQANLFQCTQPTLNDEGLYEWDCSISSTTAESQILVLSRSIESVDKIIAGISQPQNPVRSEALRFIGLVAELPYTGAEPSSARDWAEITLLEQLQSEVREEQRAVFGDVLFRLSGEPTFWTLEMGQLPGEEPP
jgi:hypothetical protein